ncbi:MAG: heme lyase CcmF/NrfE family subunit [Betaproteobacteria bacterium]|jgi:cytochrome c-type biogenesis protein CcmF|nr:heme lyase CcmF/NrfE family subunit [Betaproteobacteria bacterium]
MIAEIGQLLLSLAFAASLVIGLQHLWGLRRVAAPGVDLAAANRILGTTAFLTFVLVAASFGLLATLFMGSDFSVLNVAENSNTLLPLQYKFAATWGSHEGSFLLWNLMLCGWTAAVALASNALAAGYRARVLTLLLVLQAFFLLFLLSSSNPFERLLPAVAEGRDLNPLLQDPFMVIHPPMLYMGYVGFAVAFAFAVAALMEGRLDPTWARWSRPWANAAWSFLTIGILLGSWWAYRELGWGGWWFWDPVENASLMPWLAGTALIHSLAVTDKRDALKSWTILLSLVAFALSLLGTFLVRSGVLTSVHAFATDPKRGIFILSMLMLIVGASLVLYALRTRDIGLGGRFGKVSRESFLLANNVLMSAALGAVMLGTLYPLFAEVLSGRKMSVGPPYFEAVFVPLLLPAAYLMAVAPNLRWKESTLPAVLRPMLLPTLAALLLATAAVLWLGPFKWLTVLGLTGALILAWGTADHARRQLAKLSTNGDSGSLGARAGKLGASYWGMVIAHLGVAAFVAGVSMVKSYEFERDLVMKPAETVQVGSNRITFIGVDQGSGPNYVAQHGVFELTEGEGKVIYLMEPQKRMYQAGRQVMTEAAIDYGMFRDVYVSLGEPVEPKPGEAASDQGWSVRIYVKPFMAWVWIACLMMAIGGGTTLFDRRYRLRRAAAPATDAASASSPAQA